MPNNNVETPLGKDDKTPGEQGTPGPNLSAIGPTKLDTKDDSELMANQEVPGADESVDATTDNAPRQQCS